MTPEESVAGFASCVAALREAGIGISGSISMPFASPWEGITPIETVDAIIEAYLAVGILKVMEISRQLQQLLGHKMESYVLRAGRSQDLIAAHGL